MFWINYWMKSVNPQERDVLNTFSFEFQQLKLKFGSNCNWCLVVSYCLHLLMIYSNIFKVPLFLHFNQSIRRLFVCLWIFIMMYQWWDRCCYFFLIKKKWKNVNFILRFWIKFLWKRYLFSFALLCFYVL